MKLEIEVYDLYQNLVTIKNNRIVNFSPVGLRIICTYQGYSGTNWGDGVLEDSYKKGWPLQVQYTDQQPALSDADWVPHQALFTSKEELLKMLSESIEEDPDI